METSLFIAKIIGVIYLSFGIGLLLDRSYYKKAFAKMLEDATYTILSGFLAIILGFLIVEFHTGSSDDWTIVISVIGWISVVKGILLIAAPKPFLGFKSLFKNDRNITIISVFVILIGLLFLYLAYFTNT